MKRWVIPAIFVVLTLGLIAALALARPSLAPQYLAPQLACACRDITVLEFSNGKVHLHILAHDKFYEFGTYESVGDHLVWHLKDYGEDFQVTPKFLGLYVCNRQLHLAQYFPRSFRNIDTSQTVIAPKSITNFLKDLSYSFDRIPSD